MLKIGDKIKCIKGNDFIRENAIGIVNEIAEFDSTIQAEWLDKCAIGRDGNTNWWIDDLAVIKIDEDEAYDIEKEIEKLSAEGYSIHEYIEKAKQFYDEYTGGDQYEIDVEGVLYLGNETETIIGHIDALSNSWLKEILIDVLGQRNSLEDEIMDLKDEIRDLKDKIEELEDERSIW